MAITCGKCGTTVEDNITVCLSCGEILAVASVPTESQTDAPAPATPAPAATNVATLEAPIYQQTPPSQQAPAYQQAPPYQQTPPAYQQAPPYQQAPQFQQGPVDPARDAYDNKLPGIMGYILFCIPLFMAPNSKFAKFHANQGLILNICAVILLVLYGISCAIFRVSYYWGYGSYTSPVVHGVFGIIMLGYIALAVVGALNASKLMYKQLPVIGKYTLLK